MGYTMPVHGHELYKHVEFPVKTGNPKSSLALCVVWQDVDKILESHPEFLEKFALIGNLRSPFGINVIMYNLALNPNIKHLIVWGPDRLSNTNIGIAGKNALLQLWQNGIDDQKQIIGTPFKLVEDIDTNTVQLILSHVKLHEESGQTQLNVNALPDFTDDRYMEPVRFSEFIVKAPETLPSEGFTYLIREKKGADAYLSLLWHIWKYGQKSPIDEGGEELKEIRDAVVVIENEDVENIQIPEWMSGTKALGISRDALENYCESQFSPELYRKEIFPGVVKFDRPKDISYLYAELMFAFPRSQEVTKTINYFLERNDFKSAGEFVILNSKLDKENTEKIVRKIDDTGLGEIKKFEILLEALIPPTDQVANVIDRIKRKKADLDKEIVLWDPRYHSKLESGRPCLEKFSFSVRENTIDVHVFVRTHDICQAWFFNFYGIARLLWNIAKETGCKPGFITIESQSAHIYPRDWDTVRKLLKEQIEDKSVRMFFDPETDGDPRGVMNIDILNDKIKIKLQDLKSGDMLFEADGTSGRELMYKIKHFKLISRTDHAAFIGSELAKAEMCLKLGIEYKYDGSIKLPDGKKIIS